MLTGSRVGWGSRVGRPSTCPHPLRGIETAVGDTGELSRNARLAPPRAQRGCLLHAFNPSTLSGMGLGTVLAFCIAAFVGFEQSPMYAEETSRPKVVVARVSFLAVGLVAVFFAISSWALSVAAGPSQIVGEGSPGSRGRAKPWARICAITWRLRLGQLGRVHRPRPADVRDRGVPPGGTLPAPSTGLPTRR